MLLIQALQEHNLGPGWIADHLDFTALSGKQADAPNTMKRILPKVSKDKADGQDFGEDRNDADPYNFLDVVETEDRLRPSHRADWRAREAVDEDSEYVGDGSYSAKPSIKRRIFLNKIEQDEEDVEVERGPLAQSKTKIIRAKVIHNKANDHQQNQRKVLKEKDKSIQRPRLLAPDLETRPTVDPKARRVTQPSSVHQPNPSSDSDEPLLPKRRRLLPFTPPESQAASLAPVAFADRLIINLEDEIGLSHNGQPPGNKNTANSIKESKFVGCKTESWSTEVISRTFLRVSADNMPYVQPMIRK